MLFFFHVREVTDDVRAAVLVDSDVAFFHPLVHAVDRELAMLELLLAFVHLSLQLFDLFELLLDFAAHALLVILSGSLLVELRARLDLSPASLGAGLEQVHGPPVGRYEMKTD